MPLKGVLGTILGLCPPHVVGSLIIASLHFTTQDVLQLLLLPTRLSHYKHPH